MNVKQGLIVRGRRQRRVGAIIVLVAVMMVVFIVSVIFSVDVAYMQLTKSKLRAATDAAARAAGEALSREQDTDASRQAAKDIAAANLVGGDPLLLDDTDVQFGNSTAGPGGAWSFVAGTTPINSVRVTGRRTADAPSGSVPTFFGRFLGVDHFEPTQEVTVVRLDRDICLVVDRSSSMKLYLDDTAPTMSTSDPRFCEAPHGVGTAPGSPNMSRWAALSAAVGVFINKLNDTPQTEHVALVSYSSDGTWCSVTNNASDVDQSLNANHALVTTALGTISGRVFNGNTNITAGLNAARGVLTDAALARPYAAKTMVLMTDGHYTDGGSPLSAATAAAGQDIVIHTVTFGDGADQTGMQDVANETGGKHFHAPDAATLLAVFEEIAFTLPVVFTD